MQATFSKNQYGLPSSYKNHLSSSLLPDRTLSLPRRIHQFPQIGHGGIINVNIGMCSSKRAHKYKYLNNLCSFFFLFFTVLESTQPATLYNVNRTIRRIKRSREKTQKKIWPSIFSNGRKTLLKHTVTQLYYFRLVYDVQIALVMTVLEFQEKTSISNKKIWKKISEWESFSNSSKKMVFKL